MSHATQSHADQNADAPLLAALQRAIINLSEAVDALHEMRQLMAAPEVSARADSAPQATIVRDVPRYRIPEGERPKKCRGCNATIYWVVTPRGRNMPVNPDGTSHWESCSERSLFKTENAQ